MSQSQDIAARFRPIPGTTGRYSIAVFTDDLPIAGRQLYARVGSQPVKRIMPFLRGGGFTGRLDRPPSEGDRLYVRYNSGIEMPTTVVYRGGGNPPLLA